MSKTADIEKVSKGFRDIASGLEAEEITVTGLVDKKLLEGVDYFESFPDVAVEADSRDCYHTPASCYQIYPHLENIALESTPAFYYVSGKVKRTEKQYSETRLQEFTMNEIVFFGSLSEVESIRSELIDSVVKLAESLNIPVEIVEASDPFFKSAGNRGKELMQKMIQGKFELITSDAEGKPLAIASFNNHGSFFTDKKNITTASGNCHSGCVAIGLERWEYAITRHGGVKK